MHHNIRDSHSTSSSDTTEQNVLPLRSMNSHFFKYRNTISYIFEGRVFDLVCHVFKKIGWIFCYLRPETKRDSAGTSPLVGHYKVAF